MRWVQGLRRVAIGATLAAAAAGSGSGCSSGRSAGQIESVEQLSISQVGQILQVCQKGQKPPPKGLADIVPLERGYPAAVASVRDGRVLVYWGVGFSDAPDAASTVLAYEKAVPEEGGEVLMQDGTARRMTADEFQAARKPPGASTDPATLPAKKKRS